MYNATEQFAEFNKAGYDNAMKLASLSLEKTERLAKLNLQAAKVALEQGVYSANAVAGVKDAGTLHLRAKLTGQRVNRIVTHVASTGSPQAQAVSGAREPWATHHYQGMAAWVRRPREQLRPARMSPWRSSAVAAARGGDQFSKATGRWPNLPTRVDALGHRGPRRTTAGTKTSGLRESGLADLANPANQAGCHLTDQPANELDRLSGTTGGLKAMGPPGLYWLC